MGKPPAPAGGGSLKGPQIWGFCVFYKEEEDTSGEVISSHHLWPGAVLFTELPIVVGYVEQSKSLEGEENMQVIVFLCSLCLLQAAFATDKRQSVCGVDSARCSVKEFRLCTRPKPQEDRFCPRQESESPVS
jgi:hypothetical protein